MNTIYIVNLPEQVFRYIFRHISSKELWVTVRQLNKSVKKYVEDYLQCLGVFALTGEKAENTMFMHIFKREGHYLEAIPFVPKSFPDREHIPHLGDYPYECEYYSLPTSLTNMDVPLLMEICFSDPPVQKSSFRYDNSLVVTTYIYKLDIPEFSWKIVKARNRKVTNKAMECFPISDSSMIMVIDTNKFGDILLDISSPKLQFIHLNMDSASTNFNNVLPVLPGYGQTRLDTPEKIDTMDGYALIGVAKNTVILISPKLLWHGTLYNENKNIVWESIDISQKGVRTNTDCFKLRDDVYILSCYENCRVHGHCRSDWDSDWLASNELCTFNCSRFDKYNYKERKFYPDVHSFPYMVTEHSRALWPFNATDKDETFAIFVFAAAGEMDKIYMFTEKEGFVEVNNTCPNIMSITEQSSWLFTNWSKTSFWSTRGRAMIWLGN